MFGHAVGEGGAQLHDAGHDALRLFIDRHQAFGMELAQRYMQCHLLFTEPLQAMQGKVDTFADADSCGPHEAKSERFQSVGETKLLLQMLILLERKGSG